jgi:plastocyanin
MKIRSISFFAALGLSALGLVASSGCELVSSVDAELMNQGGGGAASATTTTTDATTTSGGGEGGAGGSGGSGGAAEGGGGAGSGGCESPSDCPPTGNVCVHPVCNEGVCGMMNFADGTPIEAQTAGDCQKVVCDGTGQTRSDADDTDTASDDGNDCTAEGCSAGVPTHDPKPSGDPCASGNGTKCDGSGACVECLVGGDCASGVCQGNACVPAQCNDGQMNGTETDVDCGGVACGGCAAGGACLVNGDCAGDDCTASVCVANCQDGAKNNAETDVDCGGPVCGDCVNGKMCGADGDCMSGFCNTTTDLCAAPACNDGFQNGTETDLDCGGAACPDCANGDDCLVDGDCASGYCDLSMMMCMQPTCSDNVQNGSESDVDCGGAACPDCPNGDACVVDADCASGFCNTTTDVCAAPTCNDGVTNQNETDIDCGGGTCADCANGDDCLVDDDCTSNMCYSGACVAVVNACDVATATDMTSMPGVTVNFGGGLGNNFSPKCLKVTAGTVVTFVGNFPGHPLMGGEFKNGAKVPAGSGPFVPITNSGASKAFTLSSTGTFPYYCDFHVAGGMSGAVFVVP